MVHFIHPHLIDTIESFSSIYWYIYERKYIYQLQFQHYLVHYNYYIQSRDQL